MKPLERPPLPLPAANPLAPPEGFAERLRAIGVSLDEAALAKLGDYLGRLLAMNALMNLTAIEEPAAAWDKHVLDALTLVPALAPLGAGARVADVGSGGGVPGIPLAIARTDLAFTLVEATQKKAAFLAAVARALDLANVTVVAERAERVAAGELAETFDAVTARAVGRLASLLPLTAPLTRPGGRILLIKGQRAEEELAEATRGLAAHGVVHEATTVTPTGRVVALRKDVAAPALRRGAKGRPRAS